jgi:hypothetical protein
MAWMKIETSAPRNRKFLKAGPGPSWLWLCGLAYCQEGLTDGFIPDEALKYLGVRESVARQFAQRLETFQLWHRVEGGWRIHDYLEHNKPAHEVMGIRDRRQKAGAEGGKASGESRRNVDAKQVASTHAEAPVEAHVEPRSDQIRSATAVQAATETATATRGRVIPFAADLALLELQDAYPQNRVTSGYRTESAFIDQLGETQQAEAFREMSANLENHKRSYEWRVKGMVPSLEKWLRDGLWRRQMDEDAPASEQLSSRTRRTAEAVGRIMKEPA